MMSSSNSSHLSASSSAASNASAAAAPTGAAAPAGAGAGVGSAGLALDDALASLSLSAAGAGTGAGADASLAMPSLAASPFHAVSAAANADPFAGADAYVYRSLHADPLSDAPVFRSVGAGGHGAHSAQYEDMSSFAAASASSSSSSHGAAAAAGGLQMPMLSANPFQPVGSGAFGGLKAKSVAPAAGAGGVTYTLNPKHQFTAVDNTEAASADVLPPEVPGYLEPAYHFAVAPSLRVLDLFGVLLPVLAAQRVDFAAPVLSADRACKVKCVSYGGGGTGRVPFVVSVFRLDKAGARLVVEFQRRSGCVMHFTNLYRAVKRDLQLKGALLVQPQAVTVAAGNSVAAAAVARFADVMPTPSDLPALDNAVTGSQAKKTVELLLEMVASDFTDVKVKAIQMLADLTAEPVYAEALAAVTTAAPATASSDSQAQTQSQVLACLSHANEDVLRCAISTVANLTHSGVGAGAGAVKRAQQYSGVVAAAEHNGVHVTALCAALHAANSSQQTVREAARALANVVACVGLGDSAQGRVPVVSAQHAVSLLAASSDAAAREHADRIAQRLQSAGHATSAAHPAAPAAAKALALSDLSVPSLALRQK